MGGIASPIYIPRRITTCHHSQHESLQLELAREMAGAWNSVSWGLYTAGKRPRVCCMPQ